MRRTVYCFCKLLSSITTSLSFYSLNAHLVYLGNFAGTPRPKTNTEYPAAWDSRCSSEGSRLHLCSYNPYQHTLSDEAYSPLMARERRIISICLGMIMSVVASSGLEMTCCIVYERQEYFQDNELAKLQELNIVMNMCLHCPNAASHPMNKTVMMCACRLMIPFFIPDRS